MENSADDSADEQQNGTTSDIFQYFCGLAACPWISWILAKTSTEELTVFLPTLVVVRATLRAAASQALRCFTLAWP